MRDTLEYWLAAFVLKSLALGPRSLSDRLARLYSLLLDRAMPRLRRTAIRNLELAYPGMPPSQRARIVDGVFRSIARLLVSIAWFPLLNRGNIRDWIRYEGLEHFEQARQLGRGVLFATAHLGNWELSAFAHALLSGPLHIVVRPLDNPKIDALLSRRRTLSGNRIIDKREFARPILKALSRNDAVGILIDQNASADNGVFVNFFGTPACAGTGFAKLAARSGAAVVPGFALWSEQEKKYVLQFHPPIQTTGDAAADTAALHRCLEQVIRDHPDQWLWIHRRWKTRPPGEKQLYSA